MRPPEKIHDPVYEKPSEVQFKIDKDIPLPPDMRSRVSKYPWGMMEVGYSLFIPMEEGDLIIERAKEWGALLIVSNVLDFHPIKIDNTGWNHIRLIDDDLYDSIEAMGTLVYRNKSNLIVQF